MDKNSYTIAEEFTLPSLGKIYEENVNPVVKLRSMTTEHEMKRLAPSDRDYQNICEVIDDCIVNDIGISVYDMCLADYQFLLHKLRVVTYGSEYKTNIQCPYCGSIQTSNIDLNTLEVTNFEEENITKYTEFVLPKTKKRIKLKMQTPRMIDDVTKQSKELNRKSNNKAGDTAFLFTLQQMIDTVDGVKLDPVKKEDFVRSLPMMDTNYIVRHSEKLVESFGLNTVTHNTCLACGLDYNSSFRITGEFFGPSIDI